MLVRRLAKGAAISAISFLLLAPTEASAFSDHDDSAVSGWMGFFGGPTFGKDDDPIMWRLSIRGGMGTRLGSAPIALDGGLAFDGGYARQTGAFDSKLTNRHIEIVPFVRCIIFVTDTVGMYAGVGAGYVHSRVKSELPILGTNTTDASGSVFRVMAGVELSLGHEVHIFMEPLGLNSFTFDGEGGDNRFSVLMGAAARF